MIEPTVYIIILNWNGLKDTLECLESVFKQNYTNYKVVVVDNGSSDDSVRIISETYSDAIVIESKTNIGFTGGNNLAMEFASKQGADYLWLLNNDTIVHSDTLRKIIDKAESNKDIGLVSPVIFYYETQQLIQFCGSYVDFENNVIKYPQAKKVSVDTVYGNGTSVCLWGTALLVKRKLIDSIGYLNDKYFAYWEDTEYSLRSIKAGFKNCVDTSAQVYHKHQLTNKETLNKGMHYYFYMTRNEFLMWFYDLKVNNKIKFIRRYFAKTIRIAARCYHERGYDFAGACFDGLWCGLFNMRGGWDKSIKMPSILIRLFLWHPYLWANLLEGKISSIVSDIRSKIVKGVN